MALGAVLIAVLGTVLTGRAAMAATPPGSAGTPQPAKSAQPVAPGLSISVSDGQKTAKAGDRLTYVVSVRDSGTAAAQHLKITQTLSAGLEFVSASSHGVATPGQVAWHADIPAGGTATFRLVAQVTHTPARLLRLAAVACAALEGSNRPIVCAAHLDRLPAFAAAPAARASGPAIWSLLVYVGAGLAVLAAGVLAGRRLRLRRQMA